MNTLKDLKNLNIMLSQKRCIMHAQALEKQLKSGKKIPKKTKKKLKKIDDLIEANTNLIQSLKGLSDGKI
jgi:hypothetical protein